MYYRLYYEKKGLSRSAIFSILPSTMRYEKYDFEADSNDDAKNRADEIIRELNKKPLNLIWELEKCFIYRINHTEKRELIFEAS